MKELKEITIKIKSILKDYGDKYMCFVCKKDAKISDFMIKHK